MSVPRVLILTVSYDAGHNRVAKPLASGFQLSVSSPLFLGMNRLGALKLGRLLREEVRDFVVSVHPTPAGALSELRARPEVARAVADLLLGNAVRVVECAA